MRIVLSVYHDYFNQKFFKRFLDPCSDLFNVFLNLVILQTGNNYRVVIMYIMLANNASWLFVKVINLPRFQIQNKF